MDAPRLYYPVKPFHVNQPFGANIPCVKDFGLPTQTIVDGPDNNTCPPGFSKLYEAFGMSGHDGTDLQAGEQPVYAACDGIVIEKQTVARLGLGLGIVTPTPVDLGNHGQHYLKVRYWHLKSFNAEVGDSVKAGDLIGISDTTGYSAGDHLHFEGDPMDKDAAGNYQITFPTNGFAGAIDIAPYFCGMYAEDIPKAVSLYTALIPVLQRLLAYLKAKQQPSA
jgi:murein DD-endopeptidase MepM/ murein hydrolase activator NlpD